MSPFDMGGAPHLIGRAALVAQVRGLLDARRSVLLFGPPGIGKSAIVAAVVRPGLVVIDPFEHVSGAVAATLRRAIEADGIVLAAGRSARAAELGAVRRVLWRMEAVRVGQLSSREIRAILCEALGAEDVPRAAIAPAWLSEAAVVAEGIPGRALAVARAVATRWRADRLVLSPRLALVVERQDGLSHKVEGSNTHARTAHLGHSRQH